VWVAKRTLVPTKLSQTQVARGSSSGNSNSECLVDARLHLRKRRYSKRTLLPRCVPIIRVLRLLQGSTCCPASLRSRSSNILWA
jgi:hypothetical protein